MRWTVLYTRSRQVPAAVAGVLTGALVIWALGRIGDGVGANLGALAAFVAAAVLGAGLTGQDVQLDRTAAIRWWPRRALHVVLAAAVVLAVMLAWGALDVEFMSRHFLLRDVVGAVGLVALTGTVLGGLLAWTVPLTWFVMAIFLTPADHVGYRVAAWMVQPDDTAAATWTAVVLGATGTIAYACFGNRR